MQRTADPVVVFMVGTVPGEGPSEDSGCQSVSSVVKPRPNNKREPGVLQTLWKTTDDTSESHGCELYHVMTRVLTEPFPSCTKQGKHEFKFKMSSNQTRHLAARFKLTLIISHIPPIKSSISHSNGLCV